jgi:NAD(P)-dependent dehydrogenase (short-subunit alcohol dehydrogenase family)
VADAVAQAVCGRRAGVGAPQERPERGWRLTLPAVLEARWTGSHAGRACHAPATSRVPLFPPQGGEAITVGANVAKRDELEALVKAATDKWGSLDVLVNNAGAAAFEPGPAAAASRRRSL